MKTTSTGVLASYQIYFNKKVLKIAIPLTVYDQFAQTATLPKNAGATTMRFFQPPGPDATKVQSLTEGGDSTLLTYRETSVTGIDVPLTQRGQVARTSDILNATGLFNWLNMATDLMGADAALDVDVRIRAMFIAAGQSPYSTGQATVGKRYAQAANGTNVSFATLAASNQAAGRLVTQDLLDGMTRLKLNRAPMTNGMYTFIANPQQTRDLMDDDRWIRLSQYSKPDLIMKGEVGNLYGCRVVETTNAQIENGANTSSEGTYDASGTSAQSIYTGVLVGQGGYGMVEMAGTGQNAPRMIIVDTPDKLDPLNQSTVAGWKAFWASCILNPNWLLFIRSKSAFNN